jgi:hypothetical protein
MLRLGLEREEGLAVLGAGRYLGKGNNDGRLMSQTSVIKYVIYCIDMCNVIYE